MACAAIVLIRGPCCDGVFSWAIVASLRLSLQVVSDFVEMKELIARLHVSQEEDDDEDGEDFMERWDISCSAF